jgi:uncharacterized protein YbjT (DUF2867 family)
MEAGMKFLISGATGTVGREIVKQLAAAGHTVRALTRNPDAVVPDGVERVVGDLSRPETIEAALDGVTGLHLINFDGTGAGSSPLATGPQIVALAKQAGVKRITVLLGGEPGVFEQAVQESGIDWTFLQPVEFMANYLGWAEAIRTEGVVRQPFASRRSAMVHEADIAAVAVAALTENGHSGQTYTITGPEALTVPQVVDTIAKAIGRKIAFVEQTEQEARDQWRAEGYPDFMIEFFVEVYGNTPEIGYTVVDTVERVTGRPARRFAQWAAEHAEAFKTQAEQEQA